MWLDSPYVFYRDAKRGEWLYGHRACILGDHDRYRIIRDLDPEFNFGSRTCGVCGEPLRTSAVRTVVPRQAQRSREILPGRNQDRAAQPSADRRTLHSIRRAVVIVYDKKRDDVMLVHTACVASDDRYVVKRRIDPTIPLRSDCDICEQPLRGPN